MTDWLLQLEFGSQWKKQKCGRRKRWRFSKAEGRASLCSRVFIYRKKRAIWSFRYTCHFVFLLEENGGSGGTRVSLCSAGLRDVSGEGIDFGKAFEPWASRGSSVWRWFHWRGWIHKCSWLCVWAWGRWEGGPLGGGRRKFLQVMVFLSLF